VAKKKSENDPVIERLTRLETDMQWVKQGLKNLDNRLWYVLVSVIIFGVISIILKLI
jgi:hypothetical protein